MISILEVNNFKVGDIVVCINNSYNLTLNKKYIITKTPPDELDLVFVINDHEEEEWFAFTRFRLITNIDFIEEQFKPYAKCAK